MKRTKKCKPIGDWRPESESLLKWIAEKMPTLDVDETFELFRDKAEANAWEYASWDAAFRNYLRKSDEWGGAVHTGGMSDPRWRELIHKARKVGFRDPVSHESLSVYRQAIEAYDPKSAPGNVIDLFDRPPPSEVTPREPLRRRPGESNTSLRARASCDAEYYELINREANE